MDDRRYSGLTKLGFGALACNSALAVYNSWGDTGSVAFVVVADATLVLLFVCLREFEPRCGRPAGCGRIKAAVWSLTALLTGMFTYALRVAPLMPLVIGAVIFLCLREAEAERTQISLGGQYAELVKMSFGVVACSSALAQHHASSGHGSLAFVFILYAGFVTLVWLFIRRFDGRARGAGQR